MKKTLQTFLIFSLALILIVTVTGCKQASSEPKKATKTEKTVKKPAPAAKKTIVTDLKNSSKKELVYAPLGDSLSVGLLSDTPTQRFSSQFTRELSKETGKKVTEKGSSQIGKTATNYGLPHVNDIIVQDPDIVTVEFGTNDAADVQNPRALPNYESSIHQILDELQNKTHAKIILMTSWSGANGPYIQNDLRFDKVIIKEGQQRNLPVVNLSKIWMNNNSITGGTQASTATWDSNDDLHPNQKGHDQIAKALIKTVNEPEK